MLPGGDQEDFMNRLGLRCGRPFELENAYLSIYLSSSNSLASFL